MRRRISIPEPIRELMEKIEDRGGEVYAVGGAVRDALLGKQPDDWDLATSLPPDELEKLAYEEGYPLIRDERAKFGVVTFLVPDIGYVDVAQFRTEEYEPGSRRPKVRRARSLREDVLRRDFTVNALASDSQGRIIDYVGGLEDLEKKRLRFVGNPIDRIKEDALRALRFVRFLAYLDFQPDWDHLEAIRIEGWKIFVSFPDLSWERIGYEVEKGIWKAKAPQKLPIFLWYSKLYKKVMPELDEMASTVHDTRSGHYGESVVKHTSDVLRRFAPLELNKEERRALGMALFLHDIAKPQTAAFRDGKWTFYEHWKIGALKSEEVLRRWRRPLDLIKQVKWLIRHHHWPLSFGSELSSDKIGRKAIAKFGREAKNLVPLLFLHAYADTGEERWLEAYRVAREELNREPPLISGRDIIALGVEPGPMVGKLLKEARRLQYEEGIKSKEAILRIIVEMIKRNR